MALDNLSWVPDLPFSSKRNPRRVQVENDMFIVNGEQSCCALSGRCAQQRSEFLPLGRGTDSESLILFH